MAELVNLRLARKRKVRTDKEVRASENRVAFGRTKAEREATMTEKAIARRRLDLHKRDDGSE